MSKVPIYAGTPPKVVGTVEDGVFTKPVKSKKHLLRSPLSWALDETSLQEVENAGGKEVRLMDADSGNCYIAAVSTIREKGFQLDRGFGKQIALGLSHWRAVPVRSLK